MHGVTFERSVQYAGSLTIAHRRENGGSVVLRIVCTLDIQHSLVTVRSEWMAGRRACRNPRGSNCQRYVLSV